MLHAIGNAALGGVSAGLSSSGYQKLIESFCNQPAMPPTTNPNSVGSMYAQAFFMVRFSGLPCKIHALPTPPGDGRWEMEDGRERGAFQGPEKRGPEPRSGSHEELADSNPFKKETASCSDLGAARTRDRQIRNLLLYPTELRDHRIIAVQKYEK